jgi:hypothetical protein
MASKKQLLQSCWISIEKRRPPNEELYILIWCSRKKQPVVVIANILNIQLDQGHYKNESFMHHPTHWMKLPGPDGNLSYAGTGNFRNNPKQP